MLAMNIVIKFFQTGYGQLFVFLTIISSIEDTTELFWCRGFHKGGDLFFAELVVYWGPAMRK